LEDKKWHLEMKQRIMEKLQARPDFGLAMMLKNRHIPELD
jgi:hypothetical protein